MDGAGSCSVAHGAGLLPTELTGMWGWILLRSPHQGRGAPPAPAPTKQRPVRHRIAPSVPPRVAGAQVHCHMPPPPPHNAGAHHLRRPIPLHPVLPIAGASFGRCSRGRRRRSRRRPTRRGTCLPRTSSSTATGVVLRRPAGDRGARPNPLASGRGAPPPPLPPPVALFGMGGGLLYQRTRTKVRGLVVTWRMGLHRHSAP